MSQHLSGFVVADPGVAGTILRGGSTATSKADDRHFMLCLILLIATVWLATRPYVGVVNDSRFYTVQALAALLPGRFNDDLYFHYGSQDQFTLFTLIYKPVLAMLGLAKAAILLTIVGECCWISGLIYLARGIFRDGRVALIAVTMAVALPAGVMFNYGEQFLTPRLFAEAATLWALGLMLRGRPLWCLLLLSMSAIVHPLMTLPGFAVLFLHEVGRRRIWWTVGAAAVIAALGLASLGVQPFVRLLEAFDPAWFAVVRVRDFFCLLTEWSVMDWLKACNIFVVAALGLSVAEPSERRFFLVVLAVALGGLALTLVGGDLLRNVLIVDAQQYRATWVLAVVANLFVGPVLLRVRWSALSAMTRVTLALAVCTLVATTFLGGGYFVTIPMTALAGIAAAWEQNRQGRIPVGARVFGFIILGLTCGLAVTVLYEYMATIEDWPSLFWPAARGLGLTAAALGGCALLVSASTAARGMLIRSLVVFAIGLTVIAALGWDQRTPWTKFIETADAAPESLSSLLPGRKPIYWEGDVRIPWFLLKRASYFSCAQGTGSLFFRGIAINYERRYEDFQRLRTLDIGQETTCPAPPDPAPTSFKREELASICAKEPELGSLVLTRPLLTTPDGVWISPENFEDVRAVNGHVQVVTTNKFFVYSCAALR